MPAIASCSARTLIHPPPRASARVSCPPLWDDSLIAFEMLDKDKDNFLDWQDARYWLRCVGWCCTDQELDDILLAYVKMNNECTTSGEWGGDENEAVVEGDALVDQNRKTSFCAAGSDETNGSGNVNDEHQTERAAAQVDAEGVESSENEVLATGSEPAKPTTTSANRVSISVAEPATTAAAESEDHDGANFVSEREIAADTNQRQDENLPDAEAEDKQEDAILAKEQDLHGTTEQTPASTEHPASSEAVEVEQMPGNPSCNVVDSRTTTSTNDIDLYGKKLFALQDLQLMVSNYSSDPQPKFATTSLGGSKILTEINQKNDTTNSSEDAPDVAKAGLLSREGDLLKLLSNITQGKLDLDLEPFYNAMTTQGEPLGLEDLEELMTLIGCGVNNVSTHFANSIDTRFFANALASKIVQPPCVPTHRSKYKAGTSGGVGAGGGGTSRAATAGGTSKQKAKARC
ncbi:unnamed protein product [Amoebophrya sp. A120]|nr:unnamed protein product [Amoebophrya sp. A120]|eukprot:GSA120T00007769001.1